MTLNHVFLLYEHSSLHLYVFVDANWIGNTDDKTSTLAYIVFLGANLISWNSKKQKTITRSTIEAEYQAITTTIIELN